MFLIATVCMNTLFTTAQSINKEITVSFKDADSVTTLLYSAYCQQWESGVTKKYESYAGIPQKVTTRSADYFSVHKAVKSYMDRNGVSKWFTKNEMKKIGAAVSSFVEHPKDFTGESLYQLHEIVIMFFYGPHGKIKKTNAFAMYSQGGVLRSSEAIVGF